MNNKELERALNMNKITLDEFDIILNMLIKKAEEATEPTAFVNGYYEALADFQTEIEKLIAKK